MIMRIKGRWAEAGFSIIYGRFVRPQSALYRALGDVAGRLYAPPGHFHLGAASSCPWSHRTRLVHAPKRLESVFFTLRPCSRG